MISKKSLLVISKKEKDLQHCDSENNLVLYLTKVNYSWEKCMKNKTKLWLYNEISLPVARV